jgi:hypothetical protein
MNEDPVAEKDEGANVGLLERKAEVFEKPISDMGTVNPAAHPPDGGWMYVVP